jgi:hypothetical protein
MLNVIMLSLVAPLMLHTYYCKRPYSGFAFTFTRLQQDSTSYFFIGQPSYPGMVRPIKQALSGCPLEEVPCVLAAMSLLEVDDNIFIIIGLEPNLAAHRWVC